MGVQIVANGLAMRSVPKGIAYRRCCVPFFIFSFIIMVPITLIVIVKVLFTVQVYREELSFEISEFIVLTE